MKTLILALLFPAGAALTPLDESSPDDIPEATAVSDDLAVGAVEGRVVLPGKRPKATEVKTKGKLEGCHEHGAMDMQDRTLLVGEDGGIANMVVTVKVPGSEAIPGEPVVLDNIGCRFEPHVVVVPAGGKVRFRNTDPTSHNVHTNARKNSGTNRTISTGANVDVVFRRPEAFAVTCDIHAWMKAWIYVTDSPFTAVTDERGAFRVDGLPPGEYEATLWHESLGRRKLTVAISAGKVARVDWEMSPQKRKKSRR